MESRPIRRRRDSTDIVAPVDWFPAAKGPPPQKETRRPTGGFSPVHIACLMLDFKRKLSSRQEDADTVLCVGLDPDPERLPQFALCAMKTVDAVVRFNRAVIEATLPYSCAFKLNLAFYEVLGRDSFDAIKKTLDGIPPDVVTIADGKRGDIGNSARLYAKAIFDELGFDACTVAPYMGLDAAAPFLEREGKAAFILGRTSNPSGATFQELDCNGEPLYKTVARRITKWNDRFPGTSGLVVGATRPEAMRQLRHLCPTLPFLIPGVGAQGGKARDIASTYTGPGSIVVSCSRSILYASSGEDFAVAAGEAAREMRDLLAVHVMRS